jgi:hypothetical protein
MSTIHLHLHRGIIFGPVQIQYHSKDHWWNFISLLYFSCVHLNPIIFVPSLSFAVLVHILIKATARKDISNTIFQSLEHTLTGKL